MKSSRTARHAFHCVLVPVARHDRRLRDVRVSPRRVPVDDAREAEDGGGLQVGGEDVSARARAGVHLVSLRVAASTHASASNDNVASSAVASRDSQLNPLPRSPAPPPRSRTRSPLPTRGGCGLRAVPHRRHEQRPSDARREAIVFSRSKRRFGKRLTATPTRPLRDTPPRARWRSRRTGPTRASRSKPRGAPRRLAVPSAVRPPRAPPPTRRHLCGDAQGRISVNAQRRRMSTARQNPLRATRTLSERSVGFHDASPSRRRPERLRRDEAGPRRSPPTPKRHGLLPPSPARRYSDEPQQGVRGAILLVRGKKPRTIRNADAKISARTSRRGGAHARAVCAAIKAARKRRRRRAHRTPQRTATAKSRHPLKTEARNDHAQVQTIVVVGGFLLLFGNGTRPPRKRSRRPFPERLPEQRVPEMRRALRAERRRQRGEQRDDRGRGLESSADVMPKRAGYPATPRARSPAGSAAAARRARRPPCSRRLADAGTHASARSAATASVSAASRRRGPLSDDKDASRRASPRGRSRVQLVSAAERQCRDGGPKAAHGGGLRAGTGREHNARAKRNARRTASPRTATHGVRRGGGVTAPAMTNAACGSARAKLATHDAALARTRLEPNRSPYERSRTLCVVGPSQRPVVARVRGT